MPKKQYDETIGKELLELGFSEDKIQRLIKIECDCQGAGGLTEFVQMLSGIPTPIKAGVEHIKERNLRDREARLYLEKELQDFASNAIRPTYLNFL